MTTDPDVRAFAEKVSEVRTVGVVTCSCIPRDGDLSAVLSADRLAASQGFGALGERWVPMDRAAARRVLVRVLSRDLAYDTEIMAAERAATLADEWLGLTVEPRTFFTNGDEGQWRPITASTFDTGVIAVDGQLAVMFWVEDED